MDDTDSDDPSPVGTKHRAVPAPGRWPHAAVQRAARDLMAEADRECTAQERSQRRNQALALRRGFVQHPGPRAHQPTPLTALMGQARGWESGNRAKVYLTLLWWSTMVDAENGSTLHLHRDAMSRLELLVGNSRRSVNLAIRDLAHTGLLTLDLAPRQPRAKGFSPTFRRGPLIRVAHETGEGTPYKWPDPSEAWFTIGSGLWTSGWMHRMPGQALAVLLILLANLDSRQPTNPIWVATSQLDRYGISSHCWAAGTRWLTDRHHRVFTRKLERAGTFLSSTKTARDGNAEPSPHPKAVYIPQLRHDWLLPYPPAPQQTSGRKATSSTTQVGTDVTARNKIAVYTPSLKFTEVPDKSADERLTPHEFEARLAELGDQRRLIDEQIAAMAVDYPQITAELADQTNADEDPF